MKVGRKERETWNPKRFTQPVELPKREREKTPKREKEKVPVRREED